LLAVLIKHIINKYIMKNKKTFIILSIALTPLLVNASVVSLPKPLSADSIPDLAANMINGILGITGAIALFYFVWGGLTWMTSGGNAEKIKKGKDTIVWAIFGLAAIFGSYVVLNFVFTKLLQ